MKPSEPQGGDDKPVQSGQGVTSLVNNANMGVEQKEQREQKEWKEGVKIGHAVTNNHIQGEADAKVANEGISADRDTNSTSTKRDESGPGKGKRGGKRWGKSRGPGGGSNVTNTSVSSALTPMAPPKDDKATGQTSTTPTVTIAHGTKGTEAMKEAEASNDSTKNTTKNKGVQDTVAKENVGGNAQPKPIFHTPLPAGYGN